MRNHSYESDFDLHENETACRTHFHMNGFPSQPRFKTESQENSEMAYLNSASRCALVSFCTPLGPVAITNVFDSVDLES